MSGPLKLALMLWGVALAFTAVGSSAHLFFPHDAIMRWVTYGGLGSAGFLVFLGFIVLLSESENE